jgi:hypothetical protein
MADDERADPLRTVPGQLRWRHGPGALLRLDPDVAAVLRLVLLALALWAVISVLN